MAKNVISDETIEYVGILAKLSLSEEENADQSEDADQSENEASESESAKEE